MFNLAAVIRACGVGGRLGKLRRVLVGVMLGVPAHESVHWPIIHGSIHGCWFRDSDLLAVQLESGEWLN